MKIVIDAQGRRIEFDDGVTYAVTDATEPPGPTAHYIDTARAVALALWRDTEPGHRIPAGFAAPSAPELRCSVCGRPESICTFDADCRPHPNGQHAPCASCGATGAHGADCVWYRTGQHAPARQ